MICSLLKYDLQFVHYFELAAKLDTFFRTAKF